MQLMTEEIKKKLLAVNYKKVAGDMDAEVIVKYFNPIGPGVWLIVAGEQWDSGLWLYGYITLGYEWEWGPVMYDELYMLKLPFGLSIERDLHCAGKTVKELAA